MRRMELQPDAGPGGGASHAAISSANAVAAGIGLAACGTNAMPKGRVGEYAATGLTAVWLGVAWQQVWLAGIIEEPH